MGIVASNREASRTKGRLFFVHLLTFLRSFSLQSSWNLERMQNLGFAFALLPALRKVKSNRDSFIRSLRRHLGFFNTHPYMSGIFLGAVITMEKEGVNEEEIDSFKSGLIGSCSAIGDSLFWATLKPISVIVATFIGLLLLPSRWVIIAPIIFLLIYNTFHLYIRYKTFDMGLNFGKEVVKRLRELNFPIITFRMRKLLPPACGILGAGLLFFLENGLGSSRYILLIPCVLLIIGTVYLLKKGLPISLLIYIAFGIVLLFKGLFSGFF